MTSSIILLLTGGSGCGKTTYANRIADALGKETVSTESTDNFYNDQSHLTMDERLKTNYDHPKSIDKKTFREKVMRTKQGMRTQFPIYSFIYHTRSKETAILIPGAVVIFEGIFALCYPECNELADIKIFLDTPEQVRFERRLYRDVRERGRTKESVIEMWNTRVKPMHDLYIEPTKAYADYIIKEEEKAQKLEEIVRRIRQRQAERGK